MPKSSRLDRIFVRNGRNTQSLAEMTDDEFQAFYGKWLWRAFREDRIAMLELLDQLGVPPVEIKAEAYDDLHKEDEAS